MFDEPLELGCRATGGRDFTVMNLHEKGRSGKIYKWFNRCYNLITENLVCKESFMLFLNL